MYLNHDYVSCILDEIALEGLDGITLQGLWLRLSERPGVFVTSDDYFKSFVWNLIKRLKDVEIYELEEPRKDLVIYNRFIHVDPELGTVIDKEEEPEDIYPFSPVEDSESGNRGSCATYNKRQNITKSARKTTLEEAVSKWGSKLVLVANQKTRTNALQGVNIDPVMELSLIQYCVLERIGRSRYHGEVTIGRCSLQQIGIDAKALFYIRKYLIDHKLITKQIFHLKSGLQNSSGSLLHITRYFVLRRPKALILTQKVVEILKSRPGHYAEYEEIRQILGLYYSLKKLMKTIEFQRLIKTDLKLPYRTVYPEAKPGEWKLKGVDKEKMVRVIQLINPDVDVEELWSKEDEEEDDSTNGILDQEKLVLDRPLLQQAYAIFINAGPHGLSQHELGVLMGQTRLESRNICRNLVKCELVSMYMQDVGRQRVTRFMPKMYSNQGEMSRQYEREKKKMLELLTPGSVPVPGSGTQPPKVEEVKKPTNQPVSTEENEGGENIETQVVEDVVEPAKNNVYTGFQEDLLSVRWNQKKCSPAMSYRLLKRANLIMECIKTHKVIYDCKKLMQHINDIEEKEGYNVKICKKTVFRLLNKLKKDGRIKYISITLRMNDNVRGLKFICEPSITKDDAVIQSAMEQAKIKFFVHTKDANKKQSAQQSANKDKKEPNAGKISVNRISAQGKKYGFSPKFVRMKLLHRFLFYLIYAYEGEAGLDQGKLVEEFIIDGNHVGNDISKELPTIFFPTICWKTFVPPLPKHSGFPDGWTFMSDWLLRIPLSLFVKIYNITYAVPMLEDYLSHPIRQHYLIKSLPPKMRKYLLLNRRYIFSIHEIVCRLCYIGLIQFGPQRLKEKDQVFIYLNRKASLLNTIPSHPGYHKVSPDIKYEEYKYSFEKMGDVDQYWYDMWNICIKTQLGGRMCVTGNNITLEALANKEAMIQATQPRNPDEAPMCDIGFVPGDHRGAAGLDSAIFSHLKRNWNWNTMPRKDTNKAGKNSEEESIRNAKFAQIKQGKDKINIVDQLTKNPTKATKPRKVNERFGKVSGLPKKKSISTTIQNLCKKKLEKAKHVVRKVLPRKTKRPKPYYDEEDRKALSKMKKLRVDWSEMEDALLLNCKVAGLYLFPNPRYLAISFQTVRDVLHQTFKESKNKTSRACQRRILYVMRNEATAHSVSLSLLDLKHDPVITERFGKTVQEAKAAAKSREQLEKLLRPTFIELVNILSKRMDTMPRSTSIPNAVEGGIEDVREKYTIAFPHSLDTKSRFNDVSCIEDIQKGVLHAVIHSSFCCAADKTSWAYQLFKVYQQYPDSFLKASMNKFRADQMITLKKQYSRYYKTGNFVPISSCPYQLSMNYAYLFQSEYQFEIFSQAHELLKKMKQFFSKDIDGKLEVTSADGGGTATLIELFSKEQATLEAVIPEQIIILDPVIAEKKEAYDGILKRFNQMLDNACEGDADSIRAMGKRKKPSESLKEPPAKKKKLAEDANDIGDDTNGIDDVANSLGDAASSIRDVENVIGDDADGIADESAMEKAEDESLLESRMLSGNATCTASRIALYMMRKELTDSPNIDPHHAHDFFVVNSCEVFCKKRDMETMMKYIDEQAKISEAVLEKIKSSTILPEEYCSLNTLYLVYEKEGADELEWRFACEIMNFIGHGKEVGVTVAELREKFGGRAGKFSLALHLKILTRERVLVRVGVTTTRYVHYEYTKPWLVHSNKLLRLQRDKLNPTEAKGMILHDDAQPSCKPASEEACEEETEEENQIEDGDKSKEENQMEDGNKLKEESNAVTSNPKPKGRTRERRIKTLLSLEKDSESLEWNSTYKIKVMIRPWIRVDGSLNRRVLDRFLGSVLGYILQNPGCCIKDLGNRFAPALQPSHTRELLEVLSEIGCVKLLALQMQKPTLFSKPSKVVLVEPDGTEDESKVFINPELDAVSKLGIFLGDKKYAVDFLGKIL